MRSQTRPKAVAEKVREDEESGRAPAYSFHSAAENASRFGT